ncbi:helix-turn-helix transcriptional regulator [Cryobacterium psychrophilum]|uniref:XRE family transcriptional regulator n=1 Tax=Cryobacterium psychrophilum TaxID=41988 RepID=A0A4Y8KS78_9MICO|nr:helix-turn-helix transcriptional regulator [Cryobacterium psychrophilum]TDW30957.1 DNA-binding XRE family transcriptional regulator [Cryobacterium psychrophilum]TFD80823.1 XRE family transcriptional regulator [Cryobacterium psychrophilum]
MAHLTSEASRLLGLRLRERRLALALNQEDVALAAGINVSNYARIDRGHGNPTFHTLLRLSHVLGIDLSALFSDFNAGPPAGRAQGKSAAQAGLTPYSAL